MDYNSIISIITILMCALIIGASIWTWRYVSNKKGDELQNKRNWIEQFPAILSTLGIFGTFVGISVGLYLFDPDSLEMSIKELLGGLKTAFITSIIGMVASIILNKKVSNVFDQLDMKESDTILSARNIVEAIKNLQKSNELNAKDYLVELRALNEHGVNQNKNNEELTSQIDLIAASVDQMRDDIEEIKGSHELIRGTQQAMLNVITQISKDKAIAEEVGQLKAVAMTATASLATMDNAICDINESASKAAEKLNEIAEHTEDIVVNH